MEIKSNKILLTKMEEELAARAFFDCIEEFFKKEENKEEFEKWKKARQVEKTERRNWNVRVERFRERKCTWRLQA